ncbi:lipase-like PAD4 [Punica granatum]|uniref:Lipase-like PAD4 n=4 Tax=Punica granatum TaxID=22663 RepID=A0A6P8DUH5_PUNGR|nr:lipase-like PAD4 [Punica granatum]
MACDNASPFETSEMLASFVASTPLLDSTWRICSHANAVAPRGYVVEVAGGVGYLAFSGVQVVGGSDSELCDPKWGSMVPLDAASNGLFSALKSPVEEEEGEERPVMVHAGFLQLFLDFYGNCNFQDQMTLLERSNCKSIVITGHSIGAAAAALTSLWLLCRSSSSSSSSIPLLCITFGSPLLGNSALSKAILRERWVGSFCHVVSKHDIIPRLLFAPPSAHILSLLHLCHFGTNSIPEEALFSYVLSCAGKAAEEVEGLSESDGLCFTPLGTYVFCSEEGGICLDNGASVVKMMHLLFSRSCPRQSTEDHFKYGEYIGKLLLQFLKRRELQGEEGGLGLNGSTYDAGVSLALQSSGIDRQEMVLGSARDCLEMARQNGSTRNLNSAHLAVRLSKITPNRAQIEWYKALCDGSEEQLGYYDTFRQMRTAKREHAVNMSRVVLATFWNGMVGMWERNELPIDFHRRSKWVNASQSYKLLVEPLDIADYYRMEKHREKGHYIENGRERRYRVFDRWWRERRGGEKSGSNRKNFASLPQDSCFWARVEEAKESVEMAKKETEPMKLSAVLGRISDFEKYVGGLIDSKEVSRDVLFANSSYSKWLQEWTALKPRFQQLIDS